MRSEFIQSGASWEVYCVCEDSELCALKVPKVGSTRARALETYAVDGGSRYFSLMTRVGIAEPKRVTSCGIERLLLAEAARIMEAGSCWNHEFLSVGHCEHPEGGRTFGLRTRWIRGMPFNKLARNEKRALLNHFLPSLWYALSGTAHGDLCESNLIAGKSSISLIDPGAMVAAHFPSSGRGDETSLTFITNPFCYPLIPPYHDCDSGFSSWQEAWTSFASSMRIDVGQNNHTRIKALNGAPFTRERPLPADQLALAILYYRSLTGVHPLQVDEETEPAWSGVCVVDKKISGTERGDAMVQRRIVPPREIDPKVTAREERISMRLFDLTLSGHDLMR